MCYGPLVALMTVKPSRGTVVFFALLGAGLTARYAMNRRDDRVVQRDAPVTHATRRLLRCVLGRDAERMLWPRPADDDVRPWANAINARLRLMAANSQGDGWPSRCVPLATRVQGSLTAQRMAPSGAFFEFTRQLTDMSASPMTAIAVAENGRLGAALASFSLEVIKSSVGTESGWTSALPYDATDLVSPRLSAPPLGHTLPPTVDGATLAAPEWVLYQDISDRRAHSLLFRERGAPADAVIAPGAPLRLSNHPSATLLATDDGDLLLPLESARPTPLSLPNEVRAGEHTIESWQSVKSGGQRWFAYVSRGRLHVWSTPAAGATAWVERVPPALRDVPVAAIALVAAPDPAEPATEPAGAAPAAPPEQGVIAPDASAALTAYILRHGARGTSLERWTFAPPADVATAAPATEANTAANPLPNALARGATVARDPVQRVVISTELVATPRGRALSCVSGTSAHFAVASDEGYLFYSVRAGRTTTGDLPLARLGALSGGRVELHCDERRALLFADTHGRPASMLLYEGEREPRLLPIPLPSLTVERAVDAVALVPGAVVAFVRTPGAVRVLRSTDGSSWSGGALLAQISAPTTGPSPVPDQPPVVINPGYSLSIGGVATYGERVAALGVGRGSLVRVVRYFSSDGGITWQ